MSTRVSVCPTRPDTEISELMDFISATQMNTTSTDQQETPRRSFYDDQEKVEDMPDKEKTMLHLVKMGFLMDEASLAIEASGPDTEIAELMDFISAARASTTDVDQQEPPCQNIPDEVLPHTRKWWPSWDHRSKLNCLQTCHGSVTTTSKIHNALAIWKDEDPPLRTQKYVLGECRKWNLIWTGKNRVSVLEPHEIELLLSYPINHTRGFSKTDRYRSLGNSFQVDTVALHFSVLKRMFPNGISALSLFSGIGGAEVALDRLGIPLKNVVTVEISEVNNSIFR
ncbi:hypothetical protein GIB67_036224, partial [Kingdonia uniflora]